MKYPTPIAGVALIVLVCSTAGRSSRSMQEADERSGRMIAFGSCLMAPRRA
jgi:hypothetical protein